MSMIPSPLLHAWRRLAGDLRASRVARRQHASRRLTRRQARMGLCVVITALATTLAFPPSGTPARHHSEAAWSSPAWDGGR